MSRANSVGDAPAGSTNQPSPRPVTAAAAAIAALVSLRMMATHETLPGWSSDPTLADIALGTSIGPTARLMIDIGVMAASVVILWVRWWRGELAGHAGVRAIGSVALACGLGVVAYHLGFNAEASVEDWLGAGDLAASFAAGTAAAALPRGERAHRLLAGVVLGALVMVAAKGLLQYFVEHQQTVDAFKASREQILASNGWEPGSPTALAYERRLMQREATGWFGLSNVFASVVGAGAVAAAGLAAASKGGGRRVLWIAAGLLGLAGLLSGSKGGIVAMMVAAGLLGALWWMHRAGARRQLPRWTSRALVLVPAAMACLGQLAIVLRGAVGERIGELSLLFRWFYMQGASRIFVDHPWIGVGPAGFKDAYMIAKTPIAPEDVASPHSWPWDLSATLGIGGVLLLAVWMGWLVLIGRAMTASVADGSASVPAADERSEWIERRLVAGTCAAAGIASIWIERMATAPETAGMKLAGLIGWIVVSVAAAGALRERAAVLGMAAAACGLALHSQIEMTPIWPGAGAWLAVMIGLAAAGERKATGSVAAASKESEAVEGNSLSRWRFSTAAPVLAVLAGISVCLLASALRAHVTRNWESLAEQAAERAVTVTRLQERLREAVSIPDAAERDRQLDAVCRAYGLTNPGARPLDTWIEAVVHSAAAEQWPAALADLLVASSIVPGSEPVREAASRLAVRIAGVPGITDRERYVRIATEEAQAAAAAPRGRAMGLSWNATVALTLGEMGLIDKAAADAAARVSLREAAGIDPFNFQHAVRLARLESAAGNAGEARAWAQQAIELEKLGRLDPLKRMDERTRLEMQRLATGK